MAISHALPPCLSFSCFRCLWPLAGHTWYSKFHLPRVSIHIADWLSLPFNPRSLVVVLPFSYFRGLPKWVDQLIGFPVASSLNTFQLTSLFFTLLRLHYNSAFIFCIIYLLRQSDPKGSVSCTAQCLGQCLTQSRLSGTPNITFQVTNTPSKLLWNLLYCLYQQNHNHRIIFREKLMKFLCYSQKQKS